MQLSQIQDLVKTLLGEKGCIWGKDQTLETLCPIFLEEAHELIEAIEYDDKKLIIEELGDFIFNGLFLLQVAENKHGIEIVEVIKTLYDKVVSRHVHIFGDEKVETLEELAVLWERVKAKEKKERTSISDGIPRSLGALMRAQKILNRALRTAPDQMQHVNTVTKEELKKNLCRLICQSEKSGIDAELALHELISEKKDAFFLEAYPKT